VSPSDLLGPHIIADSF